VVAQDGVVRHQVGIAAVPTADDDPVRGSRDMELERRLDKRRDGAAVDDVELQAACGTR
jgi:hypothetical protein